MAETRARACARPDEVQDERDGRGRRGAPHPLPDELVELIARALPRARRADADQAARPAPRRGGDRAGADRAHRHRRSRTCRSTSASCCQARASSDGERTATTPLLDRRRRRLRAVRRRLRQPRGAARSSATWSAWEVRRMLELFQTEWCPASERVRERLTEARHRLRRPAGAGRRETRTALAKRPAPTRSPRSGLRAAPSSSARTNILVYLSTSS